jgi:hypothetical protein
MSLLEWLWRLFDRPSPARREKERRDRIPFDVLDPPPPVRRLPIHDVGGMPPPDDD